MNGWLARFGRTVAQQMLEGVEDRLASPRQMGLRATVAGHGLGGEAGEAFHSADDGMPLPRGPGWTLSRWAGSDAAAEGVHGPRLLSEPELLMGSGFELSGETVTGGAFGAWGRGGFARFDGLERTHALDGDITTGTLGVDYAKGPWLAGLALSHSWGVGSYGRAHSQDDIEALLTGLYPYAGLKVTDKFSAWGVGGFGLGVLTLTPERGAAMETDIGLTMAAVAARGTLLKTTNGYDLALQTDGFWVHTTAEEVVGLLAADTVVTRVRLGLESSYTAPLGETSSLVPKLELGVRHDGGDAETGWGVDVGGGLLWSAPLRGVSMELQARSLIGHQTEGFRDWGVSGRLRYDPSPSSDRGLSASLESSIGSTLLDGRQVLLDRATLAGLSADEAGGRPPTQRHRGLRLPDSARPVHRRPLGGGRGCGERTRLPGGLPGQSGTPFRRRPGPRYRGGAAGKRRRRNRARRWRAVRDALVAGSSLAAVKADGRLRAPRQSNLPRRVDPFDYSHKCGHSYAGGQHG